MGSAASGTVRAASIPRLGDVLVNGEGLTLYVLASEKGGKVTCTAAGSCTKYWPPAVLPSGMAHGIAGAGLHASLLGTVVGPAGDVRLTYNGWPLYTYSGDSAPGQATGQGVKDVFGTWWVLSPSGTPITALTTPATTESPVTTAAASRGAGPGTTVASPPPTAPATTAPASKGVGTPTTASTRPPTTPPTTAPATTAPISGGAGF